MSIEIPRNTTIATTMEKTFITHEGNQSSIPFGVYEGERTRAVDNSLRGGFTLSSLTVVNVRFEIDQDGNLHVSAEDKKSGLKVNLFRCFLASKSQSQKPKQTSP